MPYIIISRCRQQKNKNKIKAYLSSVSRAVTLACKLSLSSICSSMSLWAFLLSPSILSSSVSLSSTCLFRAFTFKASYNTKVYSCQTDYWNESSTLQSVVVIITWSLCSVCACLSSSNVMLSSLSFLSERRWDANTEFFSLKIRNKQVSDSSLYQLLPELTSVTWKVLILNKDFIKEFILLEDSKNILYQIIKMCWNANYL